MNDELRNDKGYLLLIDDDEMIQAQNKRLLERRKYPLQQAYTLKEANAIMAAKGAPRAIILDVVLPDGNGMEFLRLLRKTSNVPVLMLTSQDETKDILEGLKAGGDNYLTKPYNSEIFVSHVEALLRRSSLVPEIISLGPINLELASGKAFLGKEDLMLSQKEFALLQQFVQKLNQILFAKELYEKVWGQTYLQDDTSLRSAVYRLRKKLSGSGYTITAEYGEGYMLELE